MPQLSPKGENQGINLEAEYRLNSYIGSRLRLIIVCGDIKEIAGGIVEIAVGVGDH